MKTKMYYLILTNLAIGLVGWISLSYFLFSALFFGNGEVTLNFVNHNEIYFEAIMFSVFTIIIIITIIIFLKETYKERIKERNKKSFLMLLRKETCKAKLIEREREKNSEI